MVSRAENASVIDPHYRRNLIAGFAVALILLILLIGEAMQDRKIRFWLGVCVCSLVALVALLSVAFARDPDGKYANSPNHEWFESQKNQAGGSCCAESDGHLYDGDYTMNADGSVTIGDETIPSYKVLTGPNPTGHAVWWYNEGTYGRTTWCFIPGAGT